MPSKYTTRIYLENCIYHVFNRGVAKEPIFLSEYDYEDFIYLLSVYLEKIEGHSRRKNYYGKIKLMAYCLMPNHFHLLIQQKNARVISEFINSLCISYAMRFNKKYNRVGHLFQDRYKARLIESEEDLVNVSKYIHRTPSEFDPEWPFFRFSSVQDYREYKQPHKFVFRGEILDLFDGNREKYINYLLDQD